MHLSLPKRFPLFILASVCWSLLCLISALTPGVWLWSLFFQACLVSRALEREGHWEQLSLASAHTGVAPAHGARAFLSTLLRLWVALRFPPGPGPSSSGDQVLGTRIRPVGGCGLPPPRSQPLVFWVYNRHAFLGVPCVYSGELVSGCDPLVDVDRPESQEVLVSREVCLHFGIGCLSGADCPLPALAVLACLSRAGAGLVCCRQAPLSPLF